MVQLAHEDLSLDNLELMSVWWDDFIGSGLRSWWRSSGGGTVTLRDSMAGGVARFSTTAVQFIYAQLDWGDVRSLKVTNGVLLVQVEMKVKLTETSNFGVDLGLTGVAATNMWCVFSAGATTWNLEVQNGVGLFTTADTGVAYDTSWHRLKIITTWYPTNRAHFFIDDVECTGSPITTNIPTGTLQPILYISTQENANKDLDVDYMVVRQYR